MGLTGHISISVLLILILNPLLSVAAPPKVVIEQPANNSVWLVHEVDISGNASGTTGTWSQQTPADFYNGTLDGLVVPSSGRIELDLKLIDDFNDNHLNTTLWSTSTPYYGINTGEIDGVLRMGGNSTDPISDWNSGMRSGCVIRHPPPVTIDIVNFSGCGTGYYSTTGIGDPDTWDGISIGPYYDPTIFEPDPYIQFYAVDGSGLLIDKNLGKYPSGPHTFRFECVPGTISIYLDGTLLTTAPLTILNCTIGFETRLHSKGDTLTADWDNFRSSYRDNGTYLTKPVDTGSSGGAIIKKVQWNSDLPPGTGVDIQIRSSLKEDMSSAGPWRNVTNGEAPGLIENARYIQYKAVLSTSDNHITPALTSLMMNYALPVEKVEVSTNEGASWQPTQGAERWSARLSLPDNASIVWVMVTDTAGATNVSKITVNVDTLPPVGEVVIDGGAAYTNIREVIVWFNATDRYGIAEMRISEDPDWAFSIWEPFKVTSKFTLSRGDGPKTLYAKLRDDNRWESEAMSDSITLDTSPPTGSIIINGGDDFTNDTDVSLFICGTDTGGALDISLSNTEDFQGSVWMPYRSDLNWTLLPGNGTRTVFLRLRDLSGIEAGPLKDSIVLDPIAPSVEVSANAGAAYSNRALVTLTINVTENCRTARIGVSQDPDPENMGWRPFQRSVPFNLSSGDGKKTIYVRAVDLANNTSPAASCSIILDTVPPGSIIGQLPAETDDPNITVSWSGSDATSGIMTIDVQYRDGSGKWVDWIRESTQTMAIFTGARDHRYAFRARAVDRAGNQQAFPDDTNGSIFVRPMYMPVTSIGFPAEAATVSGVVKVSGRAYQPDFRRTVLKVELRIDNGSWEIADGTSNWTFRLDTRGMSNGRHSIQVRAFDGERYSPEAQTNFTVNNVKPAPMSTLVLAISAIVVIAIVCAVATVAILRRKRRNRPEVPPPES